MGETLAKMISIVGAHNCLEEWVVQANSVNDGEKFRLHLDGNDKTLHYLNM